MRKRGVLAAMLTGVMLVLCGCGGMTTDEAKDYVIERSYTPEYGARPIKRFISSSVETALAKQIIRGNILDGDEVVVRVKDDELFYDVQK